MLEEGTTHTSRLTVTPRHTAAALGSGDLDVLATPALVALMENAAMLCAAPGLGPDDTTVGGSIDITHLRPSKIGAIVSATATLSKIDGRRLHFEIEALDDGSQPVGHARHIRIIVNRDRFFSSIK